MISQAAIDLIIECEVSSKAYYEKNYRHPEWPGGASGITIAIGYDLGYASLAKCHADWGPRCPDAELKVMDRCLGVRGDPARQLLPSVKSVIDIPWDAATAVFLDRDIPQWTRAVCNAIPGADKLSPDCLGALVSLAYNRGASFDAKGDRYAEMRAIKAHIVSGNLPAVADDIRSMKRLWPTVHGLRARRDAEAALFERGLKNSAPAPVSPRVPVEPAKTLPPAPANIAEHGSSGGSAAATAKAIQESVPAEHVWSYLDIALAVGGCIAVAVIVWLTVRWYRSSQPVLARAKDQPVT